MFTITMRPLLPPYKSTGHCIVILCGWEEAFVVCTWPILSFSFGYCCFNRIINLRPKKSTERFFSPTLSALDWYGNVK